MRAFIKLCITSIMISLSMPSFAFSWLALQRPKDGPPTEQIDATSISIPTPKPLPRSPYGNPPSYVIDGERYYVLSSSKDYTATGIASWYGEKFQDHPTADGEIYDVYKMTAAHRTLPIPCFAKVTNLENGHEVIVKINDRGPFEKNRLIDLSYVAAEKLDMLPTGTALVKVTAINTEPVKPIFIIDDTLTNKNHEIFVQLGAYHNLANAKRSEKLAKKITTLPSMIEPMQRLSETIYRVEVGPVSDIETTDQLINRFKIAGLPPATTFIKEVE